MPSLTIASHTDIANDVSKVNAMLIWQMLYSKTHYLENIDMDDDLKIPEPIPRWMPDRKNDWFIIEYYDSFSDDWYILTKTQSGREAENLLTDDPTRKIRMYIAKEE